MKLIAGLGNPGKRYERTRHNIGFCITERLVNKHNVQLKKKFLKKCKEANISIFEEDVLIIQPLTFMNLSGRQLLHFYKTIKLDLKDILVVCDDVNLPIGKIRLRPAGSAGGHNGLSSIIDSLKSDEFPRLRIGIKTEDTVEDLSNYVLSEFKEHEKEIINNAIASAVSACESWIQHGMETAMNSFN